MEKVNKQTFVSSAFWKIAEALSTKGISFVISVILARILLPEDYGIVALTAVFISLSTILVQSGLSTALIRKESVDETDYNNGFFIGFAIAAVCYALFFVAAPAIAEFYDEGVLVFVLRVQMLSLFLVAMGNIQTVIISREFRFRELCLVNIIANLVGGMIGVILAYSGFGVWALVYYTLLRDAIITVLLCIRIKWIPSIKLDFNRMHELVGFSMWVLTATVVDFVGNNYSSTLMGKKYSMSDLGVYNKGNQIPEMVCLRTFGAISSVMLPTMSAYQYDIERLKRICKRLVRLSCYIIFPMMTGLALIGSKLIPFLYTEKWNACIPVFVFSCIYYGVNPLRSINMQLIYATGRSKKGVLIESVRMIMLVSGTSICAFVLKTNIYGMAAVSAVVSVINVIITQYFTKRFLGYGYLEWIMDMASAAILCVLMAATVLIFGMIPICNQYFLMFLQIGIGGISYIIFSALFKNQCYGEICGILRQKLEKCIRKG